MSKKKKTRKQEKPQAMTSEQPAEQVLPEIPAEGPIEEAAPAGAAPTEKAAPAAEVTAPEDQLQALQQELAQAKALAGEYLDGWQRSRADFLNYKKRVERDMESAYTQAAASILTRQLPVLDDLERALKERPTNEEIDPWIGGIGLIYRKLLAILETEGVETIEAQGEMFDPTLHEAVTFEKNDGFREGQVIDVLERGYRIGEKVLRPAKVRVAS